jgi:hypothetical protein
MVRAGVLRWGKPEKKLLKQLFDSGEADPAKSDPDYMLKIHGMYPLLSRHETRNFYTNYRNSSSIWITNKTMEGGRRPRECLLPAWVSFVARLYSPADDSFPSQQNNRTTKTKTTKLKLSRKKKTTTAQLHQRLHKPLLRHH